MKPCFGRIYPDLSSLQSNETVAGKVFRLRSVSPPGMFRQSPQFEADLAAWENCQRCESYQSCIDLSNAKFAMRHALSRA